MMRWTKLGMALTLATLFASGSALAAETLGKGVKLEKATKISDIYAKPADYDGKTVRVEGLVTDVCAKRGCWMAIAGDQEFQSIRVKVEDGVIVFPMSARGKRAIVEGVLQKKELTMEQSIAAEKHECEEKGKPFDAKNVKGPRVTFQIAGTGAILP
ncbi:DUF4920 domain-containing protein [Myxococcota bacterium]|nr:DUF4920 domain-containing protein [Myxococcota bacterium]